jgi:hypothetical protein
MAEPRRKHDRVLFQKGFDVNIMAIDGTWRRTCTLKDVSVSGARLINVPADLFVVIRTAFTTVRSHSPSMAL